MTRDEILALEPGEKLDELLEQKVFGDVSGLIPRRLSDSWWGGGFIVEAMREKGWLLTLYDEQSKIHANFHVEGDRAFRRYGTTHRYAESAYCPTAPHAVALAALLALEGEGPE